MKEGEEGLSEYEKNFNGGKGCLVFGDKEDIPHTGIGNLLRGLRIEASKTLGEISRFMGIKTVEYSDLERGRTYPSVEQAEKFAEFYGIGYDILVAEMALETPQTEHLNEQVYPWNICMQLKNHVDGISAETNFGSLLFRLIEKADMVNKTKLRSAYPAHFRVFERWIRDDGKEWLQAMVDKKEYEDSAQSVQERRGEPPLAEPERK